MGGADWEACHAAGMTVKDAAVALNRMESSGRSWAKRYGKVWKCNRPTLDSDVVATLLQSGMTLSAASRATGYSKEGLSAWADRHGLSWTPHAVAPKPVPPPRCKPTHGLPVRTVLVQRADGCSSRVRAVPVTLRAEMGA